MKPKNQPEDTGRDCPFCGGEILQQKEHLPNGSIRIYNQCRFCEAQWSEEWLSLREGRQGGLSSSSGSKRVEKLPQVPRWVWLTLVLMTLFVVFRLGGAVVLRLLIGPLMIGVMIWLVVRLGQDQGWWSF